MRQTILYEKCFMRQTIFCKNRLMNETILVFPLLLRLVFCGKMMVFYMAVICMFRNYVCNSSATCFSLLRNIEKSEPYGKASDWKLLICRGLCGCAFAVLVCVE